MSHSASQNNTAPLTQPAAFDISKLIIEKPEKQGPTRKLLLGGLTLLFWGAWSFLWTPLINTLGWAFGFYAFYEHLIVLRGWQGLVNRLPLYVLIVQIMGGSLILWAILNWSRFKGKERRQAMRDVTAEDVADWRTQAPVQVAGWQKARRLVVHYDHNGKLTEVEADR